LELEGRYTTMAGYMRGHVRQTNTRLAAAEARLSALEMRSIPPRSSPRHRPPT
jgi:hypothetical protein